MATVIAPERAELAMVDLKARDWFAGKALSSQTMDMAWPPARLAMEAYRIADARLRERLK